MKIDQIKPAHVIAFFIGLAFFAAVVRSESRLESLPSWITIVK